jgi:3-deoxy-7-phosphoheptulonate synthase
MIIRMKQTARLAEISSLIQRIEAEGGKVAISRKDGRATLGLQAMPKQQWDDISTMPGIEEIVDSSQPFKLVSRDFKKQDTIIHVGSARIGGGAFCMMAGPCSVESEEQIFTAAKYCQQAGATILRGGAYKPRSSPYSFQGLGETGLKYLAAAGKSVGLPVITEVLSDQHAEVVSRYADILQVGARNMQNFKLLEVVGKCRKPVLLKRGLNATIKEFLLAAEYIYAAGSSEIIFCERGIRTFETYTRNTLDISAVPALKDQSHLPVIIDPSHASGRREMVLPLSKAALAAGADGLMIETHPKPEEALSDGPQSLPPQQFADVMQELKALHKMLS